MASRRELRHIERSILGWDVASWRSALRFWRRYLPRGDESGSRCALELGCGRSGGLSLWLAREGWQVVCSFYPTIHDVARQIHRDFGAASRIRYEVLDARDLPYAEQFDVVCYKSMLGGILRADPGGAVAVVRAIWRALRPGGWLFFAENLPGTWWHRILRRRFGSLRDGWVYPRLEELIALHADFRPFHFTTFGLFGVVGDRLGCGRPAALVDRCLAPVTPSRWHYALAAAACKPPASAPSPDLGRDGRVLEPDAADT